MSCFCLTPPCLRIAPVLAVLLLAWASGANAIAPAGVTASDGGRLTNPDVQTRYVSGVGSGTVADPYVFAYENRDLPANQRVHVITSTTGRAGFPSPGFQFTGSIYDPGALVVTHAKIIKMNSGNLIMYGCTSGANCHPLRYSISTDNGATWSVVADVIAPDTSTFGAGGGVAAVFDDGTDVYLYEQGGGGDLVVTKSDPAAVGDARYYTFLTGTLDPQLALASTAAPSCPGGWSPTGDIFLLEPGLYGLFLVPQCDNGLVLASSPALQSGWTVRAVPGPFVLDQTNGAVIPPRNDLREATVVTDDVSGNSLMVCYTADFGAPTNNKRIGCAPTNVPFGPPTPVPAGRTWGLFVLAVLLLSSLSLVAWRRVVSD